MKVYLVVAVDKKTQQKYIVGEVAFTSKICAQICMEKAHDADYEEYNHELHEFEV